MIMPFPTEWKNNPNVPNHQPVFKDGTATSGTNYIKLYHNCHEPPSSPKVVVPSKALV
jgi:hypothetical protein